DGSLAWVPRDKPIRILAAPGSGWRAGTLVELVGQSRATTLPPASGTKNQREAHRLLDELSDRRGIQRLLRSDRDAFRPWADALLGWDEDRLAQLETLDYQTWWQLSRGAGDEAVDRFTAKRPSLMKLLIGVDTEHSLERIAELARKDRPFLQLCHDYLL